jgi:hypothetical protein
VSIDDFDSAAGALRSLVIHYEGTLPASDITNLWEFVNVGELGLAFETLCTQLDEYDIQVGAEAAERLKELGAYLKVDPAMWQRLGEG